MVALDFAGNDYATPAVAAKKRIRIKIRARIASFLVLRSRDRRLFGEPELWKLEGLEQTSGLRLANPLPPH